MANRSRTRARAVLLFALSLSVAGVSPATAADEALTPGWLQVAGLDGKFVFRDGSRGKFLEDYNVQSGADITLGIDQEFSDGSAFGLRGFGQTGEKQGYLDGDYSTGPLTLNLGLQSWTEYYNERTGRPRPNGFPFTNDGRTLYGNGIPSTDWFTVGGDFDVEAGSVFHDVYGGFYYRDVNGKQTTQKSGTVNGLQVPGSGPGSVDFGFPGRKKVDYDTYSALAGTTTGLGNINWQTNLNYQYQDNQSKLAEPIYGASTLQELDRYDDDGDVHLVRYDLSGGRHLASDVYVFGSGFFSFERNDPEPNVQVTTGAGTFRTRSTESSKVTRFTPALTFGSVYTPTGNLVVSADTSVRGYIQKGDLDEFRDESAFLTGDVGNTFNHVERDSVVSTTRITADWKLAPRMTLKGEGRYQYRYEDVDSRQDTAFVAVEPSEVEKYDSDQHRLKLGTSLRYRMRQGRSVEGGYQFNYTDVSQNIDRLENQFILGDFDSMKHRAFLKASGRLMKKLRGELRAQYVYEERDMDSPSIEPNIVTGGGKAKVDSHYWNVSPVLYYVPSADWSVYGNYSIGQLKIESDSGGTFKYEVLTQSLTGGVTYRVSQKWSASTSYTGYLNDDDVQNIGHNASLTSEYEIDEHWSVNGGYRYLGYNLDDTNVDDYDAHVVTLGVTGRF